MKNKKTPCIQGQRAVLSGKILEGMIESMLLNSGYKKIEKLDLAENLIQVKPNEKWFCRQYNRIKGIYNVNLRIDFFLMSPEKYPDGLAIEVKFQKVGGSVDEKYPFVILNMFEIFQQHNIKSVLFLEGKGYRKCALTWCLKQNCEVLTVIEGMENIISWVMNELI